MRILIAAGGSGGHIFPAIALARTLKDKYGNIDIKFVGSDKALDKRIFEKEGFNFSLLSANKLPHKASLGAVIFFTKLLFDVIKSFFVVISYRPDVVVGFGGYIACPVIFVSYIFRIPTVAHEQNVAPGRANAILFRLVNRIAISFDGTKKFLGADLKKAVFTGNPIRQKLFRDDKELGITRFGLDENKFTILVIGGSQGAHFLNHTFIRALSSLREDLKSSLQVIHITGLKDYEWAIKSYEDLGAVEHRVYSFIDRIEEAYSASDLVVTRSGASAIFEIAFFGRPMILIPYPFAMSHQKENARVFVETGAAVEIDEHDLSDEMFKNTISSLVSDRDRLKSMAEAAKRLSVPEASNNLAREVLNLNRS